MKVDKEIQSKTEEVGEILSKQLLAITEKAVAEANELLKSFDLQTKMKLCLVKVKSKK